MPEETVWRGTSSQWKNFGLYILCALFCWLIVPIFIALARYLQTKNKVYELTTERLKITEGVFSKVSDTLELYRVKDLETRQPFLQVMSKLEPEKSPTAATFKVSFTSERICLLGVCLIVNQLPWAPVRSCKCTAFHVLCESAPQV